MIARDLNASHHGCLLWYQSTRLGEIVSFATAVPDAPYVTVWTSSPRQVELDQWTLPATHGVEVRG